MKKEKVLKYKPKTTHIAMSKTELARYMDETKKSHHVFKNKKKYDRKRLKAQDFKSF